MADPERGRGGGNKNGCLCFCLVLAILIIVLLLVILFIALLMASKGCHTPECVSAAADLMAPMNRSAPPCEDFYEYACGNWEKLVPKHMLDDDEYFSWHPQYYATTAVSTTLLKALRSDPPTCPSRTAAMPGTRPPGTRPPAARTTKAPATTTAKAPATSPVAPGSTAIKKAKQYFAACNECPLTDADAKQAFNWLIEDLGSWELTGAGPTQMNWKMGKALGSAHRYLNRPFFALEGTEHSRKPGYKVYPVSGFDFLYDFNDAQQEAAEASAIQAVVDLIGPRTPSIDVKLSVEGIWGVYERLYEMYRQCKWEEEEVMTLRAFGNLLGGEFDFLQYWRSLTGDSRLPDQNVTVTCPSYFRQLRQLDNPNNPRSPERLSNAIVWNVVRRFAFELRPHFFERSLQALTNTPEQERWEHCISVTRQFFPGPLSALYVESAISDDDEEEVEEMARQLAEATKEGMKQAPVKLKKIIEAKEVKLSGVALKEQFNDTKAMDAEYDDYTVGDDPFDNLVSMTRRLRQREREDPQRSRRRPNYGHGPFHTEFQGDILRVGGGYLQKPYYSSGGARAVSYGALGSQLGYHFIAPILSAVKRANESAFTSFENVFLDQRKFIGLNERRMTMPVFTLVSQLGALRVAHDAYRKWDESHDDTAYMVGLQLTNEQIFFLSYVQSRCKWLGDEEENVKAAERLTTKEKLTMTLANSRQFAEAYHCPEKEGTLNPPRVNISKWEPYQFHFVSTKV